MSQQNLEVIERIYAAWLQGAPFPVELVDPDIELHADPEAAWVGVNTVYRGHAGMLEYLRAVYEAFDDYHPQVERLLDVDDKVVTLAIESGRGKQSGAEVQSARTAHVWTLKEGRAVRLDLYIDRERTLAELGLEV